MVGVYERPGYQEQFVCRKRTESNRGARAGTTSPPVEKRRDNGEEGTEVVAAKPAEPSQNQNWIVNLEQGGNNVQDDQRARTSCEMNSA